jgi:hypothetical protein
MQQCALAAGEAAPQRAAAAPATARPRRRRRTPRARPLPPLPQASGEASLAKLEQSLDEFQALIEAKDKQEARGARCCTPP